VPPQLSLHDIAQLEQLQVSLDILIADKEMVGEGHKARAYTIIRREYDIKFLVIHRRKSRLKKKKKLTTKKQKLR